VKKQQGYSEVISLALKELEINLALKELEINLTHLHREI